MKTLHLIRILFLVCILSSCDEKNNTTQEQEAQYIQQLYTEIQTMASSVPCENESQWNFTSYGSKACGGPVGFIAYPNTIDVNQFLQKVAAHRIAQENYNEKWQIASDCAAPVQPIDVVCENNLPVFVY